MTYGDIKKTSGFLTNSVIDNVVNNARWAYTKKAFKTAIVSEYDMATIQAAAKSEGVTLPRM